jgi:hypothetical protein
MSLPEGKGRLVFYESGSLSDKMFFTGRKWSFTEKTDLIQFMG